ncbi:MAG: glycosyltransferase, partial [Terriglobales bacterium]
RPHLGPDIEYVGEVNLKEKNELLGGARALLFPIAWEEPFGLVMIEAMACGAPVLAFGRGSVPEVVANGASGWICAHAEAMALRAAGELPAPAACRAEVARRFSVSGMVGQYTDLYQRCLEAVPQRRRAPQALVRQSLAS